MSEHTKTPWKAYQGEDTNWWWIITDSEGFELGSGDGGWEEGDARHIVHCVNNHERLVELLKDAQNVWGEYLTTGGGSPVAHSRFVKAARKFIDESQALLAALEAEKGGEL